MGRAKQARAQRDSGGIRGRAGEDPCSHRISRADDRPRIAEAQILYEPDVLEIVVGESRDEFEGVPRSEGRVRTDHGPVHGQQTAADSGRPARGPRRRLGAPTGGQTRAEELRANGWVEDDLAVAEGGDMRVGCRNSSAEVRNSRIRE